MMVTSEWTINAACFTIFTQTISAKLCISYRNRSFDLQFKSNDWFLREMQHWFETG